MAAVAVLPAMNGEKAVHPFFVRAHDRNETNDTTTGDEALPLVEDSNAVQTSDVTTKEVRKKRRPRNSPANTGKTQKTLQEIVDPKAHTAEDRNGNDVEEVPNTGAAEYMHTTQRKRRRISQERPGDEQDGRALLGGASKLHHDALPQRHASPQVIIPASSPLPASAPAEAIQALRTPPKKMLRLNASGKFSSPVCKKPKDDEPVVAEEPKRRGRPRKSKDAVETKQGLVVIKYSREADTGDKIDQILQSEQRLINDVNVTPKKKRTRRKQKPPKPTHPFFTRTSKDKLPPPKQESPRKASAVTPGKLRRQTLGLDRLQGVPEVNDTWTSALLRDRLIMKHPGAKDPEWPSKEQAHVRGLRDGETLQLPKASDSQYRPTRKRKTARKPIPPEKSILKHFALHLKPEEDGILRPDGYQEPHPSLRLPQKSLIYGQKILKRVGYQLSSPLYDEITDELSRPEASQNAIHPAIRKLQKSIPISLSAFDEGRGETSGWAQKYTPSTVAEVLQPTREMNILREWLSSLTVTAVEGTSKAETRLVAKAEVKPRRKRRRKNTEMDDFLVDSDEDAHGMDELSEPEDAVSSFHSCKPTKSVVQTANDGVQLSNAVLLSGPSGSGKTAAAYAVAKELGFKVFEINPCERRNGKDVLDKVGDMTENHLVKHHGVEANEISAAEEPSHNDEAFERDLASGRQGKMNAFFKPQIKAKQSTPKKKVVRQKPAIIEALQEAIKKPPKDQQQSLILLEEVDILFKDDKEFWNIVFKLIITSKRPFIMTCNDEDLVPLQAMALHAILRFSPPPSDLATDYLLLIAAAEGHLLSRAAVSSLYTSKHSDLRATISELNLWCQMGVGDPRGGLSWIYQRYPPGSDLDHHRRQLRVVSEGTFQSGMGVSPDAELAIEDQVLWVWDEFGVEPTAVLGWRDMPAESPSQLPMLKTYASFADALSATDVYSDLLDTADLDTTQPPMQEKARSQYIEGLAVLQADELLHYNNIQKELAITSVLAAYGAAGLDRDIDMEYELEACVSSASRPDDNTTLLRRDFACFDAISVPAENVLSLGSGLAQSAFDGPLEPVATDIAPYVRSIVQYELKLAEQRQRLSNIMGDGRNGKRARTTRAARSAFQGSQRASTRREKWFTKNLDFAAVLATGGEDWPKTNLHLDNSGSREGTEEPSPSAESLVTE